MFKDMHGLSGLTKMIQPRPPQVVTGKHVPHMVSVWSAQVQSVFKPRQSTRTLDQLKSLILMQVSVSGVSMKNNQMELDVLILLFDSVVHNTKLAMTFHVIPMDTNGLTG